MGMETNARNVLCLAPMAGVTDWPLRVLCYRMGADYACSEMVSAIGFMCAKPGNDTYRRLLTVHPEEPNTACQLFGKDETVMAEAAARITEMNRYKSIDINMGCPARKVVSGGEGSALLLDPDKAYRLMAAVQSHTTLPVTVKTRLGYDEDSMNAIELGRAAQSLGFQWICFHGRTRQQQYSGTADYAAIARLKEQLTIPVIANGDVFAPEEAVRIQRETGADGIMIGRATFGDPWIFQQVSAALAGQEVPERPILKDRIAVAVKQFELSEQDHGEHIACLEARKHFAWYLRGVRNASYYKKEITSMNKMEDIYRIAKDIARDLE